MRSTFGIVTLLLLATPVFFTTPATAQTAPGSAAPAAPAAVQPTTKPVDCVAGAQGKGLSGQAMRDAVALCVMELRLACLKEAIDKKIVGRERRAFMASCSGRPGRRR